MAAGGHLGTSDLRIGAIGLGTWALGGGEGDLRWTPTSTRDALDTVRHAAARGITWIDTAPIYGGGRAELLVGRALRTLPPDERPLVFTKCGLTLDGDGAPRVDLRPASLRAECDASLERLGVEHIDLLQIHWPGDDLASLAEGFAALQDLRRRGKVRHVGLSNPSVEQLDACRAIGDMASIQVPLSMLERRAAPKLAHGHAHGLGGLVYSVLQSGLLSGAFRPEALTAGDWRRGARLRFEHQNHFREPALGRNLALVQRLKAIAGRMGARVPEVAIAWALAWPGVSGAIIGARRPDQVDTWAHAAGTVLDSGTLREIRAALAQTGAGAGPTSPA